MEQALSSITLDKNIPIPLYYQLKKQLLALIEDSTLKDGDMLPPENDLCTLLHVSRPTIRQALGELVSDGYLNRFKGKGTFIARSKVKDRFFSKLESFNNEMRQKGMTPHTRVLGLERVAGKPEVNEWLELPFDAELLHLSRVRSADNVQLVYVETYLSYEKYKKLFDIDFTDRSLYESLEAICNVRVDRVLREIEAVNARAREAELLEIAPNKAICLVKTVSYCTGVALPVEYSIARYRGDLNKFGVEIRR